MNKSQDFVPVKKYGDSVVFVINPYLVKKYDIKVGDEVDISDIVIKNKGRKK